MLAFFNVGPGPGAPSGAMKSSSYVFGSTNADTDPVLNGARGAYINPSNFAARDAAVFGQRGQCSCLVAQWPASP